MSIIKSSADHITINADGAGKNILFQANGVQVASISSDGDLACNSVATTETVVGIAGETISAGELVFFFTDGKVMLGDNRELGKSILSGFATNDAVLDGAVTIQSSGSLDEFTGLTIGTQYFLGNTAELIVKGSIATSEYIVSAGVAISATELDVSIGLPEPTVNQGSQLAIGDFLQAATSGDRSAEGLKQIAFDNAISTANFPILWEKIGHKYNAQHFAAGDTDLSSQALLFYPTPIPGAYNRSGIPDISVSGTTATLPTGFRNGTLFLVKSGTDQAAGTELFVRRTGASTVTYHSSEAGAIANTGAITVTGVGILTQEGIYLDDAGQQITGGGIDVYGGTTGPAGALKSTALANIATAGAGAMGQTSITFDSADSPDARTTNETRPKTSITFGYIKAEHITTSGEPISALRYDTEWVANSDWTNAKLLVNHDLNTSLAGLLVKFYIILDTVEDEDKVIEVDFSTDQATETGLMPYQRSLNQIVVQTGINGILITEDGIVSNTQGSGKDRSIISDAYFYKVVITKPNLVATYADTGFRKVYDITTATDETFTLPDASTQLTEYFIKRRGAGAGVVNFTTVSSQTINGNPASSWGLKGESDITLLPVGDKWEVKDMNGFTFHVQDQKASGTACGAFTAGAWRTRVLNTVVENSITGASLSSNQITLPAGTYRVIASAPAQKTDWHKIKLYNITDSTDDIIGINAYGAAGAENVQTDAKIINALVTIAGTKVFEIQHRCLTTKTINGFGVATSFGVIEIYTAVFIEKIA